MAKIYMMDVRLEAPVSLYVRAESEEQALQYMLEHLQTAEGRIMIGRKLTRAVVNESFKPVVGMTTYGTGNSWPEDMFDMDAVPAKEEIA